MSAALLLAFTVSFLTALLTAVTVGRAARQSGEDFAPNETNHGGALYFLAATIFFSWVLIYGSLTPFWFVDLDWSDASRHFARILSDPIAIASRSDWVGNILVAVPLGFFGLATVGATRRRWLTAFGPLVVLPAAVVVSLGVEFAQVWSPARVSSSADVVAQALGAGMGACLWLIIGGLVRKFVERKLPDPTGWGWPQWCLAVYVGWLIIAQLLPLDLTLSPRALWWKYQWGGIRLIPFVDLYQPGGFPLQLLSHAAVYLPVGFLLGVAMPPGDGGIRAWRRGLTAGFLLAGGLELAQLFVFSRSVSTTEWLFAVMGVGLGGTLALLAGGNPAGIDCGPKSPSP